jgi:poly(3-hydroxybutyrate) depolymerase
MLFFILACKSSSNPLESAVSTIEPAPLAEVSGGSCPDPYEGRGSSFISGGVERRVHYYMPEGPPENLPVLFYWHPLGGTGTQMANYLELQDWAEANQVIVVAPDARSDNTFEWDFWNGQDGDLVLYDDLRTCTVELLKADVSRVYASGMSAGGLWTSYLGVHRGDTLAAILPFSGGDGSIWSYETPAYAFPALLAYGGDSDTWGGGGVTIDFQAATLQFAGELAGDGHLVATCNHNGGHTLPPETMDITTAWLLGHVYGEKSPFEGEELAGFPEWCGWF